MNANELMIGNYILNDGVVVQADGRTIFDIWSGTSKKYEPIPITEDWLIKFGFEDSSNNSNTRWMTEDGFEIEQHGNKYAYCIWGGKDNPGMTHFIGHCKYVHQLQNLYFALTRKELTI